jgi:organic radical activating enzyme
MIGQLSEIFTSYQGEGLLVGEPQLFLRFAGCNLKCAFCDTPVSQRLSFSPEELKDCVSEEINRFPSISLTGGEPLLQGEFLKDFLKLLPPQKTIYLETNGTLVTELKLLLQFIDIISMDFKLPSTTGEEELWEIHQEFLKIASQKKVFIKAVISSETSAEDIIKAGQIIREVNKNIPFVLQPISSRGEKVALGKLFSFERTLREFISDIRIIPQIHKVMGWR